MQAGPDAVALRPSPAHRDLADRLGEFAQAARGAFSANTERAVRADLAVYFTWCAQRGLGALPAAPATVAAFIDAMAATRAPATVRRYVATIAIAHRAIGRGSIIETPPVGLALKRMHRSKGRRQGQARPLTWPLRERLLKGAADRPIDRRNRALLAVAYDTMLRRSELVALDVCDLLVDVRGDATVLVRRSKTDAEGRCQIAWVAPDTVALVRAWLDASGVSERRLFRSVDKGGRIGERLDPSQVPRIFKQMARRAGLPPAVVEGLSGHSTRVGAAQDMVAAGIGLPAILQAGRWKVPAMVSRYGERLLARNGAAAQLARIQGRGP